MKHLLTCWIGLSFLFLSGCASTPKIWEGEVEDLVGTWTYKSYALMFKSTTLVLEEDESFLLYTSDRLVGLNMQGKWMCSGFVLYLTPEKTQVRGKTISTSEVAAKYLVLPVIVRDGESRIVINGQHEFMKEGEKKPPRKEKQKKKRKV